MCVKSILIFMLILGFTHGEQTWLIKFDDALDKAEAENKTLLLYFSGSDWCRPCILLKKNVFETGEFLDFAKENFILAMFDFPAHKENQLEPDQIEHNEKMAELYNPKGNFPHIVLISKKGEKISEFSGYNGESATEYITKLQKALTAK